MTTISLASKNPEARKYSAIAAWGKMLGSFSYYVTAQQEKAAADNAPLDAVYFDDQRGWVVISDCAPETQASVRQVMGA